MYMYVPASKPIFFSLKSTARTTAQIHSLQQLKMEFTVFPFPPSTTHLTQPLDKGVFEPFKEEPAMTSQLDM